MWESANDIEAIRARAALLAKLAKEEDLGRRDITSGLLESDESGAFNLLAREPGVFCGRLIAEDVLSAYGETIVLEWTDAGHDGARVGSHPLASLRGPCRDVLAAERVLLNFLQRLSGIATLTRAFVDAVAHTRARVYDTRKTIPGWRFLDKYAVRCGGGHNHRMGLHDAVLIKDNHLAGVPASRLAAHVFSMLNRIGVESAKPSFVEVEADSLEQVEALFDVIGIDIILLDNFTYDDMRQAVALRDERNLAGKVELEASGGVTLDGVRAVAETGVDRIAVGAITHSAPALDLSLERS